MINAKWTPSDNFFPALDDHSFFLCEFLKCNPCMTSSVRVVGLLPSNQVTNIYGVDKYIYIYISKRVNDRYISIYTLIFDIYTYLRYTLVEEPRLHENILVHWLPKLVYYFYINTPELSSRSNTSEGLFGPVNMDLGIYRESKFWSFAILIIAKHFLQIIGVFFLDEKNSQLFFFFYLARNRWARFKFR